MSRDCDGDRDERYAAWIADLPTSYMPTSDFLGVRVYGCNIRVQAECQEARTVLERYILPTLPRIESDKERSDVFVRVVQAGDQLLLTVDDVLIATADRALDLVLPLIRVLDDAVIQHLTSLRAVHAGTVLLGGSALLLPGSTHAGKSSLVAELLRRGATYFSDEYALIDSEGRVHPYPRPLLLRNGSPEQFPVLAGEFNAPIGLASAQVGWIMSLHYGPSCTWGVESIPQGEAVLTLLRNTPHVLAETPDLTAMFQRAVESAVCYTGYRAEAAQATDEILRLVSKPV